MEAQKNWLDGRFIFFPFTFPLIFHSFSCLFNSFAFFFTPILYQLSGDQCDGSPENLAGWAFTFFPFISIHFSINFPFISHAFSIHWHSSSHQACTNYQGINAMEAQKTRLDELVKKHRLSQIDVFRLLQQGALNAQKQWWLRCK